MITAVRAEGLTLEQLDWLNSRHCPRAGVIIAHVPPGCDQVCLAEEILHALGRPVPGRSGARNRLAAWATAWIATADPRTDLVLYGAERLAAPTLEWLRSLGELPRVNVWLLVPEDAETAGCRSWHWTLFHTHGWHRRQAIAERPRLDLPHFPESLAWAGRLGDDERALLQLTQTGFNGSGRYDFDDLLRETNRPRDRNVATVLARAALVANSAAEVSVIARLLEHGVFRHGAVLRVDTDQTIATLNARLSAVEPDDETREAPDPATAARSIVELARQPTGSRVGAIGIATDGRWLDIGDGDPIAVPTWYRWPLRAAAWQRSGYERQFHRQPSVTYERFHELPTIVTSGAANLRASVEPLASALLPAITLKRYTAYEPWPQRDPVRSTDPFGPAQAEALWAIRDRTGRGISGMVIPHDGAKEWLAERDLIWFEHGRPRVQGWLERALRPGPTTHGPEFPERPQPASTSMTRRKFAPLSAGER